MKQKQGENNYDFALSFDTEQYDYADAVELKEIYGNSVIVQLAEALVNVFENSKAVEKGFSYARYFNQEGIDSKWKKRRPCKTWGEVNGRKGNAGISQNYFGYEVPGASIE
mgnify:FL=1